MRLENLNTNNSHRVQRFASQTPMSGQFAKPKAAPPMNTRYVPVRNPNYTPSGIKFLTSGHGKILGGSK